MSKVLKQVEVSQEADALFIAFIALVKVIKAQLGDGFQFDKDITPIVAESFKDLPMIVANVAKLGDDLKEDRAAFIRSAALAAEDLLEVFAPAAAPVAPKPAA